MGREVGGDHRGAAGQGLKGGEAEPLVPGGDDQGGGAGDDPDQVGLGEVAGGPDGVRGEAGGVEGVAPAGGTDQDEGRDRWAVGSSRPPQPPSGHSPTPAPGSQELAVGGQQRRQVLAGFAVADEQQVALGEAVGGEPGRVGGGRPAPGGVDAEGGDDQAVGGQPVLVGDLGGDGGGGGADDRAAAEGAGDEVAVAGRGVGHHLREAQVGEVVDGDDGGGPAGRRGDEVGGVEDVDRAGQPLDRGPGQPGPGGLEQPGRRPAAAEADPGAGGAAAGRSPVPRQENGTRATYSGSGPARPARASARPAT